MHRAYTQPFLSRVVSSVSVLREQLLLPWVRLAGVWRVGEWLAEMGEPYSAYVSLFGSAGSRSVFLFGLRRGIFLLQRILIEKSQRMIMTGTALIISVLNKKNQPPYEY